jgi:hypothetical protein
MMAEHMERFAFAAFKISAPHAVAQHMVVVVDGCTTAVKVTTRLDHLPEACRKNSEITL